MNMQMGVSFQDYTYSIVLLTRVHVALRVGAEWSWSSMPRCSRLKTETQSQVPAASTSCVKAYKTQNRHIMQFIRRRGRLDKSSRCRLMVYEIPYSNACACSVYVWGSSMRGLVIEA